jgi:hypothetical protein
MYFRIWMYFRFWRQESQDGLDCPAERATAGDVMFICFDRMPDPAEFPDMEKPREPGTGMPRQMSCMASSGGSLAVHGKKRIQMPDPDRLLHYVLNCVQKSNTI